MSKFAALVYGRTRDVDFRMLAAPNDFTPREVGWAEHYILTSMGTAETLSAHPRWLLVKDEQYCFWGTTCMARDLPLQPDTDPNKYTFDMFRRPLYVFVGFVVKATRPNEFPPIPLYQPEQKMRFFSSLYEAFVIQNWDKQGFDVRNSDYIRSNYCWSWEVDPEKWSTGLQRKTVSPSFEEGQEQRFFRDGERQREILWHQAIMSPKPVSLLFGMSRIVDVYQSSKVRVCTLVTNPSMENANELIEISPPPRDQARKSDPETDMTIDLKSQTFRNTSQVIESELNNVGKKTAQEGLSSIGDRLAESLSKLPKLLGIGRSELFSYPAEPAPENSAQALKGRNISRSIDMVGFKQGSSEKSKYKDRFSSNQKGSKNMDIIVNAIVTAAVAGLASGAKDLMQTTIKDLYTKFKSLLAEQTKGHSDVQDAVAKVEKEPTSKARQDLLKEELEKIKSELGDDVIKAAEKLTEAIYAQRNSSSQTNIITGQGDNIAINVGDMKGGSITGKQVSYGKESDPTSK